MFFAKKIIDLVLDIIIYLINKKQICLGGGQWSRFSIINGQSHKNFIKKILKFGTNKHYIIKS
jgi:hypothetical protein